MKRSMILGCMVLALAGCSSQTSTSDISESEGLIPEGAQVITFDQIPTDSVYDDPADFYVLSDVNTENYGLDTHSNSETSTGESQSHTFEFKNGVLAEKSESDINLELEDGQRLSFDVSTSYTTDENGLRTAALTTYTDLDSGTIVAEQHWTYESSFYQKDDEYFIHYLATSDVDDESFEEFMEPQVVDLREILYTYNASGELESYQEISNLISDGSYEQRFTFDEKTTLPEAYEFFVLKDDGSIHDYYDFSKTFSWSDFDETGLPASLTITTKSKQESAASSYTCLVNEHIERIVGVKRSANGDERWLLIYADRETSSLMGYTANILNIANVFRNL